MAGRRPAADGCTFGLRSGSGDGVLSSSHLGVPAPQLEGSSSQADSLPERTYARGNSVKEVVDGRKAPDPWDCA